MVLLARRALQERFSSKVRESSASAGAGEGIEVGCHVCVLSGRHFPLFGAGDTGKVVRVDKEALNCDVLFDGAVEPVPVALRHLKLTRHPNASAMMAAALRVPASADKAEQQHCGRRSAPRSPPREWASPSRAHRLDRQCSSSSTMCPAGTPNGTARASGDGWEELAEALQAGQLHSGTSIASRVGRADSEVTVAPFEACHFGAASSTDATRQPSLDAPMAKASNGHGQLSPSTFAGLVQPACGGGQHDVEEWAVMAKLVGPEETPSLSAPDHPSSSSASFLAAHNSLATGAPASASLGHPLQRRLGLAEAAGEPRSFGPMGSASSGGTLPPSASSAAGNLASSQTCATFEGGFTFSNGVDTDHSPAVADSRTAALEAKILQLEERHRAEVESLRGALEEALAFGRRQEARAAALEQQMRVAPPSLAAVPAASPGAASAGSTATATRGGATPGTPVVAPVSIISPASSTTASPTRKSRDSTGATWRFSVGAPTQSHQQAQQPQSQPPSSAGSTITVSARRSTPHLSAKLTPTSSSRGVTPAVVVSSTTHAGTPPVKVDAQVSRSISPSPAGVAVRALTPTRSSRPSLGAPAEARRSDALFDKIDTNRDGLITREEFAKAFVADRGGGVVAAASLAAPAAAINGCSSTGGVRRAMSAAAPSTRGRAASTGRVPRVNEGAQSYVPVSAASRPPSVGPAVATSPRPPYLIAKHSVSSATATALDWPGAPTPRRQSSQPPVSRPSASFGIATGATAAPSPALSSSAGSLTTGVAVQLQHEAHNVVGPASASRPSSASGQRPSNLDIRQPALRGLMPPQQNLQAAPFQSLQAGPPAMWPSFGAFEARLGPAPAGATPAQLGLAATPPGPLPPALCSAR